MTIAYDLNKAATVLKNSSGKKRYDTVFHIKTRFKKRKLKKGVQNVFHLYSPRGRGGGHSHTRLYYGYVARMGEFLSPTICGWV